MHIKLLIDDPRIVICNDTNCFGQECKVLIEERQGGIFKEMFILIGFSFLSFSRSTRHYVSCAVYPRVMELPPPGGASTRELGLSVMNCRRWKRKKWNALASIVDFFSNI